MDKKDCIIQIKEPLVETLKLTDPKSVYGDKPIFKVYGICDPRISGMFWYSEDEEGEKPKLSLFEEPFYVGQSLNFETRRKDHIKSSLGYYEINPLKEEIIREILAEGLEPIFVILKEGLYFEEANEWEKYYIELIGRIDSNLGPLLNQNDGGQGFIGSLFTESRRNKIRNRMKGKWDGNKNPMYNSKRFGKLNPFYNQKHTDESKIIIGEKRKLQIVTEETREKFRQRFLGENNPSRKQEVREKQSKAWTKERKEEYSRKTRGKKKPPVTLETRLKMSNVRKGKPISLETRINRSNWIYWFKDPDGNEYSNIYNLSDFCKENNLHKGVINQYFQIGKNTFKGWFFKREKKS